MKSKAISLKFVSGSDEPVGYLMVETDDEKFAKQTAHQWGESKLDTPFTRVELHQGILDNLKGSHILFLCHNPYT